MSLHDAILLLLGMGLGLAAAVFLLGGMAMVDRMTFARGQAGRNRGRSVPAEPPADRPAAPVLVEPEDHSPPVLPEPAIDRAPALPGAEPVVSRTEALHPLDSAGGADRRWSAATAAARLPAVAAPAPVPSGTPAVVPATNVPASPKPPEAPVEPAPETVNRTVEEVFTRAFFSSKAAKTATDKSG